MLFVCLPYILDGPCHDSCKASFLVAASSTLPYHSCVPHVTPLAVSSDLLSFRQPSNNDRGHIPFSRSDGSQHTWPSSCPLAIRDENNGGLNTGIPCHAVFRRMQPSTSRPMQGRYEAHEASGTCKVTPYPRNRT